MRGGSKVLLYLAGAGLLGVATVKWFQNVDPDTAPPPTPVPAVSSESERPTPRRRSLVPLPPFEQPGRLTPAPPVGQTIPTTYTGTTWEEQIDHVLNSPLAVADQAQQLRAVFPSLPVEAQVEAAGHMANLTEDEDYALGEILTDPLTPEEALQILLIDLSNRPESIRLPLLVQVARVPNHPLRNEALEELAFLLDEDHGNDWSAWETAVHRALEFTL